VFGANGSHAMSGEAAMRATVIALGRFTRVGSGADATPVS
jgi:hypothetical protein